jgi:predicted amidohydrolase YtcJ
MSMGSDVKADIILHGGKIVTVDNTLGIGEAVAIKDDRFIGVGSTRKIKNFEGTYTEIIDLEGNTVTPGFIDGHAHMDREGLKFLYPSLSGAKSVSDLLKIIEQEVKRRKPGEWIVTMPFGEYPF